MIPDPTETAADKFQARYLAAMAADPEFRAYVERAAARARLLGEIEGIKHDLDRVTKQMNNFKLAVRPENRDLL